MKVALAAVALCLAQDAVTLPQDAVSARGGKKFTLSQMRNERFRGHDVLTAFVRAHLKYGKSLPENMSMALQVYSRLLIPDDASKLKGRPVPCPLNKESAKIQGGRRGAD